MELIDYIFIFLFLLSIFNLSMTFIIIKKRREIKKIENDKKIIETYEEFIKKDKESTAEYLKNVKEMFMKLHMDNKKHFDNKIMYKYEENGITKEQVIKTNQSSWYAVVNNHTTTKKRLDVKNKKYRNEKATNTRLLENKLKKIKQGEKTNEK